MDRYNAEIPAMNGLTRRDRVRLAVNRLLYPNVIHAWQLNRLSLIDWVSQIVIVVGFISPVAFNAAISVAERGRITWSLVAIYILSNVMKAQRQMNSRYQQKAKENYGERKTRLAKVILRLSKWE